MIYFDYNATTPLDPTAKAAWIAANDDQWYNPSSPYRQSARVHRLLEDCRERLATLLGCESALIVFNSGATEGNYSLLNYLKKTLSPNILVGVSAVEHPCVYDSAHMQFGNRCHVFPANASGVVDVAAIEEALGSKKFALISIMAANNETGVVQPWQAVAELCHKQQALLHVDAAQWLGKESLECMSAADCVTGCAHKFGGPKGVGFLKISTSCTGYQAALGGTQENAHRAGTENYPGVVAMMAALEARLEMLEVEHARLRTCKAAFEAEVTQSIPGVNIIGADVERLANTSLLMMPAYSNTRWVLQLEKLGFQVSTGSACATGKAGPSHVLSAMGISADAAKRAVRVSGGWTTTREDWSMLAKAMVTVWKRLEGEAGNSCIHI